MSEVDRIRWHCRRGLLELDIVLARFLDRHLDDLDRIEREAFKSLLMHSDNDLWDMISGRAEPPPEGVEAGVLELLRNV
ncbi:MAG: succinate dehydrogenase assembly factor 2 [Burkholderiales bacterium]|nr:succinate dehydrogenase assembly factor 2 [Burkholderiales bacterium]